MKKSGILLIIVAFIVVVGANMYQGYRADKALEEQAKTLKVQHESAAQTNIVLAETDLTGKHVPEVLKIRSDDRVMGDMNAPVTLIEYASMTCGHCADFHIDILSEIKKEYIDTGKVKVIVRHLPWDNMALAVSAITLCAPKEQFYNFLDAFFRTHKKWTQGADPLSEIKKVARMMGMNGEEVDACIRNPDTQGQALYTKREAIDTLKIKGTPTIFINGERLSGVHRFRDIKVIIDMALEQTKQAG